MQFDRSYVMIGKNLIPMDVVKIFIKKESESLFLDILHIIILA